MYLRFAIEKRDEDSGRGLGIFHAARELHDHGDINEWDAEALLDFRDWFNANLDKPTRFTASKRPWQQRKAISWFKDTATEHIERVQRIIPILKKHGIVVQTHRTERVGYIVYEDEFQIVAKPFADIVC